jgi:DNA-binding response OmpR family regulator
MMTRALVVDDDPVFARVVSELLSMTGYETVTAHSAGEALALSQNRAYDVAVVDIALPGPIDGVDVVQELRELNRARALILITGCASEDRVKEGIRAGAYTCIYKPCDLDALLAVVNRALDEQPSESDCQDSSKH